MSEQEPRLGQQLEREFRVYHEEIQAQIDVIRTFDTGTLVSLGEDAVWGALAVSRGGVLEKVSNSFVRLVQAGDRESLIGRPVLDFVVEEERPRVTEILDTGSTAPYFTRLLTGSGEEVQVEVRASYSGGGRIAAIRRHHGAPCPLGDERCPLYRVDRNGT